MFVAFTRELKYDRFACGKTSDEAMSKLIQDLVKVFTVDGIAPEVEWKSGDSYIVLNHEGYQYGYIHTETAVMKVTPKGVGMWGGTPEMSGSWEV